MSCMHVIVRVNARLDPVTVRPNADEYLIELSSDLSYVQATELVRRTLITWGVTQPPRGAVGPCGHPIVMPLLQPTPALPEPQTIRITPRPIPSAEKFGTVELRLVPTGTDANRDY